MKADQLSDKLELRSMYLSQAVMHAHGIALSLGDEVNGTRKGVLRLDPNWCGLDPWGDRTGCTKMGIRSVKIEATRMRTYDQTGHRRVMHKVHSSSVGFQQEELNLVEFPDAHLWYLVGNRKEAGTFVVPLFPAELMIPSTGGIIATRYGVAIREVIERGDVEEMRAEAELVRTALSDSDHPDARAKLDSAKVTEVRQALAELQDALAKLED